MTTEILDPPSSSTTELQLATFYVGDLLLGLQIDQVQEINRRLDITRVPHAPECVRGVINLRGDVVTVIDLRTVLGIPDSDLSQRSRNLVVNLNGELVGLCVDQIADIITIPADEVSPAPSNISNVDEKYFTGVYTAETEIIAILNLQEALDVESSFYSPQSDNN